MYPPRGTVATIFPKWRRRAGTAATCGFLGPYPAGEMAAVPVTTHVNNPRNNDPTCVMPLTSEN
jgi:hypothetical protein